MASDHAQPHPPGSDTRESKRRIGIMLAEFWQEWFEAMSEVAYETHKACEYFARTGASANEAPAPFDFRPSDMPFDLSGDSVDVDKLKQCLQPLDTAQATRVIFAVQAMQAMEAMLQKRRSQVDESEDTSW